MEHNLQDSIALLTRTPAALNAFLRGLPETWTHRNEGHDTWSACDTIGHLIHCERDDWMPRARIIRQYGEARTFDPFDREGFKTPEMPLDQRLDEFARLRSENLDQLRAWNLQP